MQYKRLIQLTFLPFALVLFLSACGDSEVQESVVTEAQTTIAVVDCTLFDDALTQIESGDVLVAEDANTSVKLIHNEDGTKYVCVVNGTAHILR